MFGLKQHPLYIQSLENRVPLNFLYYAVFLVCDRVFDARFKNGFGFSFE